MEVTAQRTTQYDADDGRRPVRGESAVLLREVLLAEFVDWLRVERGLAAESVRCYRGQAAKLLAVLPDPLDKAIAGLDAAAVSSFVLAEATSARSVWSAKAEVTALRAFLRFLHVRGLTSGPLVGAVPAVAGWRLAGLPRGLSPEQVTALLATPATTTPVGLRDHAVLTVLADLGLRGAEVAALRLDDLDWRHGEVLIRGKAARTERLPLTATVGAALADYLTGGRPSCTAVTQPTVFLTVRAPIRPLNGSAVRAIMARACHRAGLPRLGPHRLRHTLATDLLRSGASLAEVGQVLRHRSELSTTVYAKVDLDALRTLARPWPGTPR
ncbi:MAG TPA: site-specific integrase [Actinomycetales bacterium]|nr:site-specific integrase [Actinomycetales bacterium]